MDCDILQDDKNIADAANIRNQTSDTRNALLESS